MSRLITVPNLLLITAAFAAACGRDDPVAVAQRTHSPDPPRAVIVAAREGADPAVIDQVVDMYNTGMNGGGWALAQEIYTAGAVFHQPGFPQVTDVESLIAELSFESQVLNDNFHIALDDVFGAGDEVVGRFTVTADFILGVPAPVTYVHPLIVVFRFENGRIAEEWWQFDMLGVQEQVGLLPRTRPAYGWSPTSTVTGDPGIPQQNASLARRAIQFVNTGNLVLAEHVLSVGYVHHEPVAPTTTDRANLESAIIDLMRQAFPDIRVTIDDVVASGDRVGVRLTFRGTQMGAFAGVPATGRQVEFTGNAIYRMADGMIVEGWLVWDAAGLLQQLTAP
jgi:steroid delta-isomerase-like uncharacterized protein